MNTTAIISEYNPFHNGHRLHIEKARELIGADFVVAVMSGNFVQRGEPAIFDKFLRTRCALLNGVDLVIEMPVLSACAAGQYFAEGAIKVLNAANIVDNIFFGSEIGDINVLKKTADIMLDEKKSVSNALKLNLSRGMSFPAARADAFSGSDEEVSSVLCSPNNILAIEYLKALHLTKSKIKPFTMQRVIADYHSEEILGEISSATAVRKAILNGNLAGAYLSVPENIRDLYQNAIDNENIFALDNLSRIFHYIIKTKPKSEIAKSLDISEGLENRIISASEQNYLISDIIQKVKTKRYTLSKIRRIILQILLNTTKESFGEFNNKTIPYIRVLGFKKSSEHLLKELHRQASVPAITNLKQAKNLLDERRHNMLEYELMTSDIYALSQNCYISNPKRKGFEYGMPIVIV